MNATAHSPPQSTTAFLRHKSAAASMTPESAAKTGNGRDNIEPMNTPMTHAMHRDISFMTASLRPDQTFLV